MVNPRYQILLFLFKTIAAFYSIFIQGISGSDLFFPSSYFLEKLASTIYFGFLSLGNIGIFSFLLYFLPFYRKSTNMAMTSFFSLTSLTSILRLASLLHGKQESSFFIVFATMILPCSLGSAGLVYLRYRGIHSKLKYHIIVYVFTSLEHSQKTEYFHLLVRLKLKLQLEIIITL